MPSQRSPAPLGPETPPELPDPEAIRQRRRGDRIDAVWKAGLAMLLVGGLAALAFVLDSAAAAAGLAVAAAVAGGYAARALARRREEEQMHQDVLALTSLYHQHPGTLREMLRPEWIDASVRNLLKARLGGEEMGSTYWDQAVGPFVRGAGAGYKQDWRCEIDVANLPEAPGLTAFGPPLELDGSAYRRLHTTVTCKQTTAEPPEVYYVALAFGAGGLPHWFKRPNFLLREVTELPPAFLEAFAARLAPIPEQLPRTRAEARRAKSLIDDQALRRDAHRLVSTRVRIGEDEVEPSLLFFDAEGIVWGFLMPAELRAQLRAGAQVQVSLQTVLSRDACYLPVDINAPTRHPTVHFTYGLSDIKDVTIEVFYSSARPGDQPLRTEYGALKRIVVSTEQDDWVFSGSGCIFMWTSP
jgi:hypothetical protein